MSTLSAGVRLLNRNCVPVDSVVRLVLSNVVFVVTVLSSTSVFSQACVQVSACLANVSCRAVVAFDLVYRSLSVLWFYVP